MNEITIEGYSIDTKERIYAESIRKKCITPLEVFNLSIPPFHFEESRIFYLENNRPGDYLIFNKNQELLYVEQAKLIRKTVQGNRYRDVHFKLEECIINGYYIGYDIDRLIYETFLINTLKPSLNRNKAYYRTKRM